MLGRTNERGDTLVEVLFAVSIFSLIVVGALSLMNQGTATSQRALESTLVRQQMDAQAETLRFMHDAYIAAYYPGITFNTTDSTTSPAEEWSKISSRATTDAKVTDFGTCYEFTTGNRPPATSFVLDPQTVRVVTNSAQLTAAQTWSQLSRSSGTFSSQGLWIEAVRASASSDPAQANMSSIDFHIRACWDAVGTKQPMTLGTIVRLYEPRG